jgi:3-oxosteroid 1-dehydrogenase
LRLGDSDASVRGLDLSDDEIKERTDKEVDRISDLQRVFYADGTGRAVKVWSGAATGNMDSAWWGPMLKLPDESRGRLLTFERALPGSIIVNQAGQRYMNEAMAYDRAGRAMLDADRPGAGTSPSFFVFDASYRRRYPMGPLLPRVPLMLHQRGLKQALVVAPGACAPTSVCPAQRRRRSRSSTLTRAGVDPLLARVSAYILRRPKVVPNPRRSHATVLRDLIVAGHRHDGGLRTNEHAQVLAESGDRLRALCHGQHDHSVGDNRIRAPGPRWVW